MNTRHIIIVLIISLIFIIRGYGQNSYSSLYNEDGYLLCDSNYKVENLSSMPIFLNDERLLFNYLITRVKYPFKAISNGVAGKVILKIKISNSKDNKHIFLITDVSCANKNVTIISEDIVNQVRDILSEYYFVQRNKKGRVNFYELFIPFELKSDNFPETSENKTTKYEAFFSDTHYFTYKVTPPRTLTFSGA